VSIADTVAIRDCIADVALLRREVAELKARLEALEGRRETLHVGNKNNTKPWAPPTTR